MICRFTFIIMFSLLLCEHQMAYGVTLEALMGDDLQAAPDVLAAKADIERARASAQKLRIGPYEIEASGSLGNRKVIDPVIDTERFDEWSVGVRRTIRLPAKKKIDVRLAELELALAQTSYQQALIQNQLEFINLWGEWRRTSSLATHSFNQAEDANRLFELEMDRVNNGAGRQVNADQLQVDALLASNRSEQDELAATTAEAKLKVRFPNTSISASQLSLALEPAFITNAIATQTNSLPEQRIAEILQQQQELLAKRARLDRLPDPTLGVSVVDEFEGIEQGVIAHFSIPFFGRSRAAVAKEATAQAKVTAHKTQSTIRSARLLLDTAQQSAEAALVASEKAKKAVSLSTGVLNQLQQGYKVGAVTVSVLLSAKRTHRQIMRAYEKSHFTKEMAIQELAVLKKISPQLEWFIQQ